MAGQAVGIRGKKRAVYLTESAVAKIKELRENPSTVLRLGVRPGGCSGFSYEVVFDDIVGEDDLVEVFDDLTVVVDRESIRFLRGMTLDYREGLMGAGFAIENPNEKRSCGCGKSFS